MQEREGVVIYDDFQFNYREAAIGRDSYMQSAIRCWMRTSADVSKLHINYTYTYLLSNLVMWVRTGCEDIILQSEKYTYCMHLKVNLIMTALPFHFLIVSCNEK